MPFLPPNQQRQSTEGRAARRSIFLLWLWYVDNAGYAVHEVSSFNVGGQIRQIVEGKASSNEKWKVKLHSLRPGDTRAMISRIV